MALIQDSFIEDIQNIITAASPVSLGISYFLGETVPDSGEFASSLKDPDNRFKLEKQGYIPTFIGSFQGSVQPLQMTYDEQGSFTIEFAVEVLDNEQFEKSYNAVEIVKNKLTGYTGSFNAANDEKEGRLFSYSLNSSAISVADTPMLLNGRDVIMMTINVFYKVFDGTAGSNTKFEIRVLDANNNPDNNPDANQFIPIEFVIRGQGYQGNMNPTAALGSTEMGVDIGAVAWSMKVTIFDNSQLYELDENLSSNILLDYCYDVLEEGNTALGTKVFQIRITRQNRNPYIRNVIVDEIVIMEDPGNPVEFTVGFKKPQKFLISKQLEDQEQEAGE